MLWKYNLLYYEKSGAKVIYLMPRMTYNSEVPNAKIHSIAVKRKPHQRGRAHTANYQFSPTGTEGDNTVLRYRE